MIDFQQDARLMAYPFYRRGTSKRVRVTLKTDCNVYCNTICAEHALDRDDSEKLIHALSKLFETVIYDDKDKEIGKPLCLISSFE